MNTLYRSECLDVISINLDALFLFSYSGEIVKITKDGVKSICVVPRPEDTQSAFCIFEYVYFARPDSILEGMFVFVAAG